MGYVTLYRKWRPQTFEEVVGQEHIIRTLTNALSDNRVAHAYIFSGPRGTGKTSVAKILAKALNCAKGPTTEPCNECQSCTEITNSGSLDVVEIDAASNRGIDEIRDLREKVKFLPTGGGTKIYIIDEVHMLTPEAFNALLKMLEEPPPHVIFVMATTEPHKVLPTILSRCQRFDFHRLKTDELAGRIKKIAVIEGIDVDDASVALIAKQARGGMRDAISTLDQLSSYTGDVIRAPDVAAMLGMVDSGLLFRIADLIKNRDTGGALVFVNEIVESGWDIRQFTKDLMEHFRNLFVVRNTKDPATVVNATADELARLGEQAAGFSQNNLTSVIETLSGLANEMRYAADPRLTLELELVKMTVSREPEAASHEDKQEPKTKTPEPPKEQLTPHAPPAGGQGSRLTTNAEKETPEPSKEQLTPHAPPAGGQGSRLTADKGSELDTVTRAWEAVLKQVKEKKMSTFALIVECRPVAVEGDNVILEFHEQADFHRTGVEKEANRKFIEDVLRGITGKPYKIKCVMGTQSREPEAVSHEDKQEPKTKTQEPPKEQLTPHASRLTANEEKQKPETNTAEGEDDKLAAIKGLFDATLLETREITDED